MEEIKEEKPMEEVKMEAVQEQQTPKKKGHVGLIIAIVCIVLLLVVVAGGVGAVVLLGNGKKDTQKTTTEKTKKASPYRLSGNGLEDFDLYFMQLEKDARNKVYSPLSLKYALAMLNEGTGGESHKQIENIIGDYKAKKYPSNEHMTFANVMFIRDTFAEQVQESYQKNLQEKYGADVILDPFTSPQPMNDWVSNHTFNLLHDILDQGYVNDSQFILMNAVAIDMKWTNLIHCSTGSMDIVPCKDGKYGVYSVIYSHEKIAGEDHEYKQVSTPYTREEDFPALTFNGVDNYKSAGIYANFNNYDIIKELGEDKIREIVGPEYEKWLKEDKYHYEYAEQLGETDVDTYLKRYIKELGENYGTEKSSTDFMLYDDDNVKAFAKDLQEYDGVTLQYVGIMPKNEDLATYVDHIKAKDVNKVINNLKEMKRENFKDGVITIVEGKIPFFKYEDKLDLNNDLKALGVTDIFEKDKVDLSKLVKDKGLVIDTKHNAMIEFSNEGIRAAAVSVMGGLGSSSGGFNYLFEVPVERIDMTFDKPYLYIIRDKATGEVWFAGQVYEPIKK